MYHPLKKKKFNYEKLDISNRNDIIKIIIIIN